MSGPRHWFTRTTALVIGVVVVLGVMTATVSADSPTAQGISVGPCSATPSGYFTPTLAPGATYTNCVKVQNNSSAPIPVIAYPVDGLTAVTSGAVFSNQGQPLHGVGTWMTVATPGTTLAPEQQQSIAFTVHVPLNTTPGDHLGAIVVQPLHGEPSPGGGFQITVVSRTAIAVLVDVPGPATLSFALDNAIIQPLPSAHSASIVVRLGNTGQLLGKPRLTVTLHGPHSYDHTASLPLATVLPGDTIPYSFYWAYAIPPGHYQITVTAAWTVNGTTHSVTRTFGATLATALPPSVSNVMYVPQATPGVPLWIPLLIGAVVVLLLASIVIIVILVRRQQAMAQETKPKMSPSPSGTGEDHT
ncbi:MAG: WxL protein peptidoglycan domain-containing protein [Acidimicrobiales bacterium]